MNNPFKISTEKLQDLMTGYEAWIKSNAEQERYPGIYRELSQKIKDEFLTVDVLSQMSDDELYDKIYKYSRKLEGPVQIRLGEPRLRADLDKIRRNLMYIMTSEDSPFMVAQNILDGEYKIEVFAKAFWSPILLAQYPDVLPNWNNKTENFLKKFGINISTGRLSIAEKYKILSEAFTVLTKVSQGNDFYNINHLMHYGTVIPEGIRLIDEFTGNQAFDPVKEMIGKYKVKIRKSKLKDELFKWKLVKKYQGRPDLNVSDFSSEIKSIDYSNLMYPMAIAVRNHLANSVADEYRDCFIALFNEEVELSARVKTFMADIQTIYKKSEGKNAHHHDERTISTFLTYHIPDKYTFFKDAFYQAYCKMIGITPKSKGEKLIHYLDLVADFREKYILPDTELLALFAEFMDADCYADENHLLKVQDILFQMLDGVKEESSDVDIVEEDITIIKPEMNEFPLNTILYGPPGTGKTYHCVSYSVAIVENKKLESILIEDRKFIKERFDEYVKDGQIVFSTFHQSLGYEDFIEGIKPKVIEEEEESTDELPLSYFVEDGIFKRLCTEAAFSFIQQNTTVETKKVLDFSTEYDRYAEMATERLAEGKKTELVTISGQKLYVESISLKNNLRIRHINGTRNYVVSKKRLSKISQAFPDLKTVTNINDQFGATIGGSNASAYWAVLNAIRNQTVKPSAKTNQPISEKEFLYDEKKQAIESLKKEDYKIANPKRFVLIIDEINRGNVSQVFGELITLIEDDKRLGKDESLKAILPYSKEDFGVPCNLYVIGSMNTADRSVEALDTALRRRFSFISMPPKPEELRETEDGIDLPEMLQVLNSRLSILKDDDHVIGHAWLWDVKNVKQLTAVFANKIIPLLQEYFYNDFEKLGLVLGDSFFELPHNRVTGNEFAPFTGSSGLSGQYRNKHIYKLKDASRLEVEDFLTLTNVVVVDEGQ